MSRAKISVSMNEDLLMFINDYQSTHGISNRSEVVERAIALLKEDEALATLRNGLEDAYREAASLEANQELDADYDDW